ncbi:MAG: Ppx/GppA phosphatase family protein [Alphaproteobacteria bacterium]
MASSEGDGGGMGRRGGRPRGDGQAHTYAAIDLGTNNCRMLIARPAARGFRVIDAFSRIVRLGEGVGARGLLREAAMTRTIGALGICAAKMRRRGVTRARGVATEACRRAANGDAFIDRVAAETGIRLEVISNREEARLAFAGCLPLLDGDTRPALVFDIGGGSTELVWMRRGDDGAHRAAAWTSLPCGVVALAEEHGGDVVSRADYDAMVGSVCRRLAPFEADHRIADEVAAGGVQMLGTSGTVTTMAGVHLDLPRYDRTRVDGLCLSFVDVRAVSDRLIDLDYAGRAAIPSVGHERADLVIAGCAIVEAIHRTWPVGSLRVADRGLREGMLIGMIHADAEGADAAPRIIFGDCVAEVPVEDRGAPRSPGAH